MTLPSWSRLIVMCFIATGTLCTIESILASDQSGAVRVEGRFPINTLNRKLIGKTPEDILGRPVTTDHDRYLLCKTIVEYENVSEALRYLDSVRQQKPYEIRKLSSAALTLLRQGQGSKHSVRQASDLIDAMFAQQITTDSYRDSEFFGNFRWRSDLSPGDVNAADFALLPLAIIRIEFGDSFTPEYWTNLTPKIRLALDAITDRHINRAPLTYTNVVNLKIANLILWGEILADNDLRQTGKKKLTDFYLFTYNSGIGEFMARYLGVWVNCFDAITKYSQDSEAKQLSHALIQLAYAQLAASFSPAQATTISPQSRTASYPYIIREMDNWFYAWGWGGISYCHFAHEIPSTAPDNRWTQLAYSLPKSIKGSYIAKHDYKLRSWDNYVTKNYILGTSDEYFQGSQRALALQIANQKNFPVTGWWFSSDEALTGFDSKQWLVLAPKIAHIQYKNVAIMRAAIPPKYETTGIYSTVTLPVDSDLLAVLDSDGLLTKIDTQELFEQRIPDQSWIIVREGQVTAAIQPLQSQTWQKQDAEWWLLHRGWRVQDDLISLQESGFIKLQTRLYSGKELYLNFPNKQRAETGLAVIVEDTLDDIAFHQFIGKLTTVQLKEEHQGDNWLTSLSYADAPELRLDFNSASGQARRYIDDQVAVIDSFSVNDQDLNQNILGSYIPEVQRQAISTNTTIPIQLTHFPLELTAAENSAIISPLTLFPDQSVGENTDFDATWMVQGRLIYKFDVPAAIVDNNIDNDAGIDIEISVKATGSLLGLMFLPGDDCWHGFDVNKIVSQNYFANLSVPTWKSFGQFRLHQGVNTLILGPGSMNDTRIYSIKLESKK